LTTLQEEWRRPAAALGRLVCASAVSRVAGCPLLLSQEVSADGSELFHRKGGQILAAHAEKIGSRHVAETKPRGSKGIGFPRRHGDPVRYRASEAIEGSFRQTDPGEILPGFVRRCPRFLHLLPFQSARVHPRAGCRRQISRHRRRVSLQRWCLDWRCGNRWSRRKVHCRAPPAPGGTRWACRGQRRRERWVWFRRRI
jgi:hypothetical protein